MVLRDPYPGLGHQFSVVFGLVWFKQRKLFTLGCTYTGSALPYSNLSWFSTGGGVSLLVFYISVVKLTRSAWWEGEHMHC